MLVVRPENSDEQVKELLKLFDENNFGFNADTIIRINEIDSGKIKINILHYISTNLFILT